MIRLLVVSILLVPLQGQTQPDPTFEVADHVDARRVGGPDGEVDAIAALAPSEVGAEPFVDAGVRPLGEQVQVDVSQTTLDGGGHGRRL